MIYLASPYTHPDPAVREDRVLMTALHAADLMRSGQAVFAPIVHGHTITRRWAELHPDHVRERDGGIDLEKVEHGFWMNQCMAMLRHADRVIVLKLAGWNESRGITLELDVARQLGIPVYWRQPEYFNHQQTIELLLARRVA